MPFETANSPPKRIAVVGAGISGLAAAHLLAPTHQVVLFEAEGRLGGHARTILAGKRGDQPVDTGFIVFNKVNYPQLTRLFEALEVPTCPSNMSFGASIDGGRIEYGLRNLAALFAQKRNALNPQFLRMLRDILHFNARAAQSVSGPTQTIGALLAALGTGRWFRDYYLLPISGAIWSMPVQGILDFPAQTLVNFFRNHALLSHKNQHQWHTVRGGSIEYVSRLGAALTRCGVDIRTGSPVAAIRRRAFGVEVRALGGDWELFDEVILATHADDSLRLLADASPTERAALSAIRYQPNQAVLHADAAMMPKRRAAWSSWVYTGEPSKSADRIDLTYWMNALQPIPKEDPLFVTLNTTRRIREDRIHDVVTFRHPVYDLAAEQGRTAIRGLNGARGTWFCGAWMRNGFHEDGFASAVDVVQAMARQTTEQMAA